MKRILPHVSVAFNKTLLATFLLAAPVLTSTVVNSVVPDAGFVQGIANAQVKPKNKKFEQRKLPSVSEAVGKKITEAYDLIQPPEGKGKPDPAKALQMLSSIPTAKANPYELANIYQLSAYAYVQQENYSKAIEFFNKVLAQSPNIQVTTEQQTYLTIGQLYSATENPKKALEMMLKWTDYVAEIRPEQYQLFANLYYQVDDKKNALLNLSEAIRLQEAAGKIPQESWYSMQRGLYLEKEDYKNATLVVEKLVTHYSKASHWKTLSQLYTMQDKPAQALSALETCYLMGGLTSEKDLLNLSYMLIDAEAPYKAAKVVQKGIYTDKVVEPTAKNLKYLADVLRAAREDEKSLAEYEKAAQKSTDGDLILGLAEMYFQNDKFKEASKWAKEAVAKGASRSDRANMTVGQAELELKNFDSAISYFAKAAKDSRSAKIANQWISHAEKQKKLAEAAN